MSDVLIEVPTTALIDKFTDGAIEAIVYVYENDMLDIYQVEELLDYFSVGWSDFIPHLTITDHITESVEFMKEEGYD
tara:strand:- start:312 stop:542 length:231 start_codon:yes stop_codon:yes gene_type:complete